jgi:hypothetical protein
MLPLIRLRNIDTTGKPQAASVPAVETRKPKPSDLTCPTPESCLGDTPVQITNWTLANSNFEPDTLDGWNLLQEESIFDIVNFPTVILKAAPPRKCVRLVDRKMLTLKSSIVPQSSSTSSRRFATLQTRMTELNTLHEWYRVSLPIGHPSCFLLNDLISWITMKYKNDFG